MDRGLRSRRGAALHIAAACVVPLLVWALLPGIARAETVPYGGFPDAMNGIHLWAPMHEPGGRFHSEAEAVAAAERYDLITIRVGQLGRYLPAMRAANPDLKVYVYMNGSYLYRGELGAVPQAAMAHTLTGDLIQSNGWGNWLGNPFNAGWIAYKQRECKQDMAVTGADGCYLDMLGIAPVTIGYGTGLPVDPASGLILTASQWLAGTSGLAAAVSNASGSPVLSNGLGSGRKYFSSWAPTRDLLAGSLGSTAETWLKMPGWSAHRFERPRLWRQDVNMLSDVNARGGIALTMTKMWGGGSPAEIESYREYALASFLLGNTGHAYFYFSPGRGQPATLDSPLYHLHIGHPAGWYSFVGGVYQRWFSNGRVLVNPGSSTVTVQLDTTYQEPDGTLTAVVTMPPHTGQILTLPVPASMMP
ncbi:MAG TPA: putative glycoside hydrolase [Gaiellales bacterium]|nr:putative glycoside hydrolase [Gaiellales bacterium]